MHEKLRPRDDLPRSRREPLPVRRTKDSAPEAFQTCAADPALIVERFEIVPTERPDYRDPDKGVEVVFGWRNDRSERSGKAQVVPGRR